jgi:hypothetical protein
MRTTDYKPDELLLLKQLKARQYLFENSKTPPHQREEVVKKLKKSFYEFIGDIEEKKFLGGVNPPLGLAEEIIDKDDMIYGDVWV